MKVAIITSTFKPELSGIAEAVFNRVKVLCNHHQCTFLILGPDYEPVKEAVQDHEKYIGRIFPTALVKTYPSYPPKIKVKKKDGRIIGPFWKYDLDKDLEDFKPDIIHVDEPARLFGLQIIDGYLKKVGIAYGKKYTIPVVAMWHTNFFAYSQYYAAPWLRPFILPAAKAIFKWVFNAYDLAICDSRESEKEMIRLGVKNVFQMRAVGIDRSRFRPGKTEKQNHEITMLYVGRITPEKNVILLLNAFLKLAETYPHLKLCVIGDGPQLAELKTRYGNHARIVFKGRIANENLNREYAKADIFINPSHTETFGMTSAEALACGLPIIVAARGGNLDMVEEHINGFFFEPDNTGDLAEKMIKLMKDETLRRDFARHSRRISKKFCQYQVAHNFLSCWEAQIKKKQMQKHSAS